MITETEDIPRSHRLKELTRKTHDKLDKSVMAASAFDDLAGYGRFLQMQWALHRDVDALYDEASLRAVLPGLAERRRLALVEADLADLTLERPDIAPLGSVAGEPIDLPTGLGWLYVIEGSNMGGALLRKEAAKLGLSDDHGARHLAPAPEGPAAHWRTFTAALDGVALDEAEEARVTQGAEAAFARAQALADACLG